MKKLAFNPDKFDVAIHKLKNSVTRLACAIGKANEVKKEVLEEIQEIYASIEEGGEE